MDDGVELATKVSPRRANFKERSPYVLPDCNSRGSVGSVAARTPAEY
jgi:hypothetical protein